MWAEKRRYVARFNNEHDAIAFEHQCLSIGPEFLPAPSVAVAFEGSTSDESLAEHYRWLNEQLDASEEV